MMDDVAGELVRRANQTVELFSDISKIDFGFNRQSVAWIEGYIERMRERADFNDGTWNGLIDTLGSFVGQCILARAGGSWALADDDRGWGILLPSDTFAFPINKVAKQFRSGLAEGESILGFYDLCVDRLAQRRP
jgi:hypothetical protein